MKKKAIKKSPNMPQYHNGKQITTIKEAVSEIRRMEQEIIKLSLELRRIKGI
ncbi:MAG TPA: hypothetical protein VMU29_12190 [Smithella sp.]|nr:hypothetical protein [Smithella sp.]